MADRVFIRGDEIFVQFGTLGIFRKNFKVCLNILVGETYLQQCQYNSISCFNQNHNFFE